ncbi:MAG TPA: YfhO family protein [Gemmataceae bacterium]|nr:YfhO family protein [Gemmataceae bacterium]
MAVSERVRSATTRSGARIALRSASWLNERWLFILTAIASILLLLVPAWPLLTRRVPIYLDLGVFHLPIRAFYSRCLAQGQSFDWCPHLYGGMFLSGEGEHGPYHPLHLLLYRCLPLDTAFALEAYLHVPLLFAGLLVFLSRYVRGTAALLGALAYTFCSGSILHNIYPNYQEAIAHLPWILVLLDAAALASFAPRRRLALSGVALLTGSQLLLGAPQAMSFSLLAETLFVLCLAWQRRPRWTFWPDWVVANLLGLAIGGVQILATRALLANSTRGSFDPLLGSLMPWQLVQLLAPDLLFLHVPPFLSSEPLYFGAVPLILALWWLSTRHPSSVIRRPPVADDWRIADSGQQLAVFAFVLGLLSGWLALGKYGYLYYLQTCLPIVGQFRLPARYFTLTALAAAMLAAVAFDRLLAGPRTEGRASWRQLCLPWAAVAAALLLALFFHRAYPKPSGGNIHRDYIAGPLFLGAAALALTAAARGRRLGLLALIALAVADVSIFGLQTPFWPRDYVKECRPTLAEYRARLEAPPLPRQGRWLDGAIERPSPVLFGQAVLQGYRGGLEPKKWLDYHTLAALRVAHAAWHHLSIWDKAASIPGLRRIGELWYEVPDPLPRVRLVSRTQVSDAPAADIQSIDIETTALATHPLPLEAGEAGTARLIHEAPDAIAVQTAAPGRRLLIVADSFDPGWRASIDDKPVTVERINGDFLGCIVERGEHEVRFVFRPDCIRYGRLLSLGGLALTFLIAGISSLQLFIRSRRAAVVPGSARTCG